MSQEIDIDEFTSKPAEKDTKVKTEDSDNDTLKDVKNKKKKEKEAVKEEGEQKKKKRHQKKGNHLANAIIEKIKETHMDDHSLPKATVERFIKSGLKQDLQIKKDDKEKYELVKDLHEQLKLSSASAEVKAAFAAQPAETLKISESAKFVMHQGLEAWALAIIGFAKLTAMANNGKETGISSLVGAVYALQRAMKSAERGRGVVAPDYIRHVASAYKWRNYAPERRKENGKTQPKDTKDPINKHGVAKTLYAAQTTYGYPIMSAGEARADAIANGAKTNSFPLKTRGAAASARLRKNPYPIGYFNDPLHPHRHLVVGGQHIPVFRARPLSFEEIVARVTEEQKTSLRREITFARGEDEITGKKKKITAEIKFADDRLNMLAAKAGARLLPNAIDELNSILYIETGCYDHSLLKLAAQVCLGARRKLITKYHVFEALHIRGIKIAFDRSKFEKKSEKESEKEKAKKEENDPPLKEEADPADLAVAAAAAAPSIPSSSSSSAAAAAAAPKAPAAVIPSEKNNFVVAAPKAPEAVIPSSSEEEQTQKTTSKRNAKRKQPSENEEKTQTDASSSSSAAAAATTAAAADPSVPVASSEAAVAAESESSSEEPAPKRSRRSKKKPAVTEANESAVVRASTRSTRSRK